MFGVSFSEIVMIAVVTLVVVGPRRLPEILGTLGKWVARLRHMTTEMRRQTGIDEILRQEGLSGGINELRSLVRGEALRHAPLPAGKPAPELPRDAVVDPYGEAVDFDRYRECPVEGPDCYGAIPEDLAAGMPEEPPPAKQLAAAAVARVAEVEEKKAAEDAAPAAAPRAKPSGGASRGAA